MNKIVLILWFAWVITNINSCKNNIQSDSDFEEVVFKEISHILIDRLKIDTRLGPLPVVDNSSDIDSLTMNKMLEDYNAKKNEIENDTLSVIAIYDTLYHINHKKLQLLSDHFSDLNFELDTLVSKESIPIKLNNFKKKKGYRLKYLSEFDSSKLRNDNYDFNVIGSIRFSRIYFNKEKNQGVLEGSFSCGKLCGVQCIILLSKKNGKWNIDKMSMTNIS